MQAWSHLWLKNHCISPKTVAIPHLLNIIWSSHTALTIRFFDGLETITENNNLAQGNIKWLIILRKKYEHMTSEAIGQQMPFPKAYKQNWDFLKHFLFPFLVLIFQSPFSFLPLLIILFSLKDIIVIRDFHVADLLPTICWRDTKMPSRPLPCLTNASLHSWEPRSSPKCQLHYHIPS